MFYCDPCAKPREWPETMFRSKGTCEVCGQTAVCNERASKDLPIPTDLVRFRIDTSLRRSSIARHLQECETTSLTPLGNSERHVEVKCAHGYWVGWTA